MRACHAGVRSVAREACTRVLSAHLQLKVVAQLAGSHDAAPHRVHRHGRVVHGAGSHPGRFGGDVGRAANLRVHRGTRPKRPVARRCDGSRRRADECGAGGRERADLCASWRSLWTGRCEQGACKLLFSSYLSASALAPSVTSACTRRGSSPHSEQPEGRGGRVPRADRCRSLQNLHACTRTRVAHRARRRPGRVLLAPPKPCVALPSKRFRPAGRVACHPGTPGHCCAPWLCTARP